MGWEGEGEEHSGGRVGWGEEYMCASEPTRAVWGASVY